MIIQKDEKTRTFYIVMNEHEMIKALYLYGNECENNSITAKEFSPKEFANEMRRLGELNEPEIGHYKADKLMCELLTKLGYDEGVEIFKEMYKWYAQESYMLETLGLIFYVILCLIFITIGIIMLILEIKDK